MISASIFLFVVAGSLTVYIMCQRFWVATTLDMQTSQAACKAVSWMVTGDGTNMGLRGSSLVRLDKYPTTTNNSAYIHSHLWPANYQYWTDCTLTSPAASDSALNFSCSYPTYNDGGSWRLLFSNEFSGVQYIEYNFPYQTLSFGTNAARRVLLAAYVTNAVITTNARGINIQVTIARRVGSFASTNTASTYLDLRNNLQ
jgi:hypothetical protein